MRKTEKPERERERESLDGRENLWREKKSVKAKLRGPSRGRQEETTAARDRQGREITKGTHSCDLFQCQDKRVFDQRRNTSRESFGDCFFLLFFFILL